MSIRRTLGPNSWGALVGALGGIVVTMLLVYALDSIIERRVEDRAHNETLRVGNLLRVRIEQDLTGTILLQKGLAAQFAINPEMSTEQFEAFARDLIAGARHVRNLGLARGTVIAAVYPKPGNEAAVGVDYRSLPDQWPAIEQAIVLRESVLAGPVQLIQGGTALVGRTPVFRSPPNAPPGSGEFLGIVSVVVSIESLLSRLDVAEIERTQWVALRGTDGIAGGRPVFYGRPDLFYDAKSVVFDVSLPGGYWQLALSPKAGLESLSPDLAAARWFGIAAAILTGLVTFLMVRYVEQGRGARRRLAASEARFRDFAESTADWFWETDAEHRFTWFSTKSGTVPDLVTATMIGQTRVEVANADLALSLWQRHVADLAAHRAFRDFEYDAHTERGHRYFRVSGVPVFDAGGAFLGYRGSAADVTDQQKSRIRLAEALYQAETANAAKSSFLAQMSHELRTPLNAIIGFAEMISGQYFGPQAAERYRAYATDILASGRHLLALVNDLLDIGRIESGDYRLRIEEIDLGIAIADAFGMVSPSAVKAGVSLEAEAAELPRIEGDLRAITQVLVNLLTNAVRFTPPGGRIRVTAHLDETDSLLLSVADTGIGIDPEDLTRVVRSFESGRDPFIRSRGGTGLGLPISQGLMRLHGGTLTIESSVGGGTVVTCRFPASCVRRVPIPVAAS